MFGARRVDEDKQEHRDRERGHAQDPMDRLRKGFHTDKNSRAFRQMVAGVTSIAAGIVTVRG